MFKKNILPAIVAAGCMPLTALGSPLSEVVVTADPLGATDQHLVQPVHVLTKEELATRNVRNLGEAVAGEPGVAASDFGPGAGRPVIRGLSGKRVKVLENGVGVMDTADLSPDHAVSTEPALAQQVEILRGPATLLYGSGAVGGVVNVVNNRLLRRAPEGFAGEAWQQYETVANAIAGAAAVDVGLGNIAVHLDGLARSTDSYDIPGFAELEADDAEEKGVLANSDIESTNIAAGLSWVGDRGFISFSVNRIDGDYGIPGHHHHHDEDEEHDHEDEDHEDEAHDHEAEDHEDEGHDHAEDGHEDEAAGGARIDLGQTRYNVEALLERPVAGVSHISMRWAYSDYNHDELEPGGAVGSSYDNDEVEGRIELVHEPLGLWTGALGLQYRRKDFASAGAESFVRPAVLDSIAAFLLEKGDLGERLHVEFGARYEWQDADAAGVRGVDHSLFNASAGASWSYAPGYELGLAVTHAQRAPSIEELYASGAHLATMTFEVGDVGLNKEKSTNVDLYWRKNAGKLQFTANLFYNLMDDFIFLQERDADNDGAADRVNADFNGDLGAAPAATGELLLVTHSQDDARFMGFELEGTAQLLDGANGDLEARLWADYVRGERDGDINLPRITPWRFGAGLSYSRNAWYAALDYARVNRQGDTAPLEAATAGYHDLRLYARYRLSLADRELTLFAGVDNLLNEEQRRHTSFVSRQAPLPGRSARFGMRFTF